jgi:hypothetical protein
MVYEVETNRLIHLFTPLFFGWTISLTNCMRSQKLSIHRAVRNAHAVTKKCAHADETYLAHLKKIYLSSKSFTYRDLMK